MSVERPEVSEKREGIRDLGVLDMVRILYSYIYYILTDSVLLQISIISLLIFVFVVLRLI